jgi:hypothetical protein
MDGVGACLTRGVDNPVNSKIGRGGLGRPDGEGLVGFANVHGLAVRGRENRNGLDAESPAAPDDSTGDLSAVGYQDPAEHQDLSHQLGERF